MRATDPGKRFFRKRAQQGGIAERKAIINRTYQLSVTRQAQLAKARGIIDPDLLVSGDLALMRRIDELHLEHPFRGARMLRDQLNRDGRNIGRKHVGTLMKRMGIEA